jgi:hypothetical protein
MLQRVFSPGSVEFGDAKANVKHPAAMPVGASMRRSGNLIMVNLQELKSPASVDTDKSLPGACRPGLCVVKLRRAGGSRGVLGEGSSRGSAEEGQTDSL